MSDLAELGRFVGKYEILKRLSAGGVAALFLARSRGASGVSQFVALKQLLPEVRTDKVFAGLFFDEARRCAGLVHPNVGRVLQLDLDPVRGDPYVAMEFIAGQSLAELMRALEKNGLQLPVPIACRIIHDVCLGLHAAHVLQDASGQPLGVVHADVTPGNVMIRYTGRVQVIDFGFARARHSIRMSRPGQAFGTLGYITPEQVMDHPTDARTDVFAAATVLYELLTGRRLHPKSAAAPRAVVIERPPAPGTLVDDIPPALDAIVLEALEKNPDQRPDSAGAFARALATHATLADEKDVAALMKTLFDERRRTTQNLLESFADEDDEKEEATVSMTIPDEPRAVVPPPEGEVTRTDRPPRAPALGDEPLASTQEVSGFELMGEELPLPLPRAGPSAPPLPDSVWDALPARAAKSSPGRPAPLPEEIWAPPPRVAAAPPAEEHLWAPPPPPSPTAVVAAPSPFALAAAPGSSPRKPAQLRAAPLAPEPIWAPPPPAAVQRAPGSSPRMRAPAAPPAEIVAPVPSTASPTDEILAQRISTGEILAEPISRGEILAQPIPTIEILAQPIPTIEILAQATPTIERQAPSAPRPQRARRSTQSAVAVLPPPAPLFKEDAPPVPPLVALWDKIRWAVAMVLLLAAIGVVTAWFRAPPSILPRRPPEKVAQFAP